MKDNILLINVMECIRLAVWLALYDVEDFHGFGEDNKNRVYA